MRALRAGFWLLPLLTVFAIDAAPSPPVEQIFPDCQFTSHAPVNFGNYDPLSPSPRDAQGRVSYRCNRLIIILPIPVRITISPGQSGNFDRRMTGGSGPFLFYNVYLDAARQQIWGDGTAGTYTYTNSTNWNVTYDVPVYARLPGAQDVRSGTYTDSLIVTLSF